MRIKRLLISSFYLILFFSMVGCGSNSTGGPERDVSGTPDGNASLDSVQEIYFGDPDSLKPDEVGTEDGVEDLPLLDLISNLCEENPGESGCPCSENKDCDSGLCTFHQGDRVCTKGCLSECPDGYRCTATTAFGADETYVCLSRHPSLCLPCTASQDCKALEDRCLVFPEGVGSFCGSPCGDQAPCPSGFRCEEGQTTEGVTATQCVPESGECGCTLYAAEAGAGTWCSSTSNWGSCSAWRECSAAGLTPCEAAEAGPEICFNDEDEDCDGIKDDPDVCTGCICGNGNCQEVHCREGWSEDNRTCAVDCAQCGDGRCDPGEGPALCPGDCCGQCGDSVCKPSCGETSGSCPLDCDQAICGDAACAGQEDPVHCPADCLGICGNHTCEPGETGEGCPQDCAAACGNCVCEEGEDYRSCPVDCGFCGDGFCLSACPAMYPPENLESCFIDCCQADCAGRECGDDGCGGSCGTCALNHVCQEGGLCLCVPACEGRECGDDGCGGSCGGCAVGSICKFGECLPGCLGPNDCEVLEECVDGYCQPDMVDQAKLLSPLQVETIPGTPAAGLRVLVFEQGLTPQAGAATGLIVQLGRGTQAFDPATNPQEWLWTPATYVQDQGDGEIWGGSLTMDQPGDYRFTFRLSLDGSHWVYADSTGLEDGFAMEDLGAIKVLAAPQITSVSPAWGSVLGGALLTVHGQNFLPGAQVFLGDVEVTPTQVGPSAILLTAPKAPRGSRDVRVVNPSGQQATLASGFAYVLQFTPVLDGELSEWDPYFLIGENPVQSNWDPTINRLDQLFAAFDDTYLYLGVSGTCSDGNYIIGYVDGDFGDSSGVSHLIDLSDNTGDGDLDDALSNTMDIQVAGFGADLGFGTRAMTSFPMGADLSGSTFSGWRSLSPPYNFPWLQGAVLCSATGLEAAIPLSILHPSGLEDLQEVAVLIKLTNKYGTEGGISNQQLPQTNPPADSTKVDQVSTFIVTP